MFFIVFVLGLRVLYCEIIRSTCFVLCLCYVYTFCIVRVLRLHVLYCVCVTSTRFVFWECYVYMFRIQTVLLLHVLYCESVTRKKNVWKEYSRQWHPVCTTFIFCFFLPFFERKTELQSRHSNWLWTEGFQSQEGQEIFLSFKMSRAALERKQDRNKWVVDFSLGLNRAEREADDLRPWVPRLWMSGDITLLILYILWWGQGNL